VVGREVGVKSGDMQGCCVGGWPGMRSYLRILHVALKTKTNRVGAAARSVGGR